MIETEKHFTADYLRSLARDVTIYNISDATSFEVALEKVQHRMLCRICLNPRISYLVVEVPLIYKQSLVDHLIKSGFAVKTFGNNQIEIDWSK
jgi:hypothetical protein